MRSCRAVYWAPQGQGRTGRPESRYRKPQPFPEASSRRQHPPPASAGRPLAAGSIAQDEICKRQRKCRERTLRSLLVPRSMVTFLKGLLRRPRFVAVLVDHDIVIDDGGATCEKIFRH